MDKEPKYSLFSTRLDNYMKYHYHGDCIDNILMYGLTFAQCADIIEIENENKNQNQKF